MPSKFKAPRGKTAKQFDAAERGVESDGLCLRCHKRPRTGVRFCDECKPVNRRRAQPITDDADNSQ
jgi:hypothetical protein